MRITAIEVTNYKRLSEVKVEPGDDAALVLIAGKNKQGKSSLLDALSAALGGKKEAPEVPVRNGEKAADIKVVLDDGALSIHRRFTQGGTHQLEVKDADGKVRSPQKRLDELVGGRFLDPLAFMRASGKEQRAKLLEVVDLGINLGKWELRYRDLYDKRTEANKDKKRLEAELEGLPVPEETPQGVDTAELIKKRDEAQTRLRRSEELDNKIERTRSSIAAADEVIADLERRLNEKRKERDSLYAGLRDLEVEKKEHTNTEGLRADVEELTDQIEAAEETNKKAMRAKAQEERREEVRQKLEQARKAHQAHEEAIKEHRELREEALRKAKMPVPGLDLSEDGVLYGDVPLSQASGAEQLRVSLSIAMAMSPHIHDIWVKDGSLLDEDSLQALERLAKDKGYRVWLERVGTGDAGALVIEDGKLRGAAEEAEADKETCEYCGCSLATHLGGPEEHAPDCPNLPY